jgi:hypothetical protein
MQRGNSERTCVAPILTQEGQRIAIALLALASYETRICTVQGLFLAIIKQSDPPALKRHACLNKYLLNNTASVDIHAIAVVVLGLIALKS